MTGFSSMLRSLRISSRTLLIAGTVIAITSIWVAMEWRQSKYEQQIAEQLNKGTPNKAILRGPYDSWDLIQSGEPQGWWRDLARICFGKRIILIDYDHATDLKDLRPLAGLTNLQVLWLDYTNVDDLTQLEGHEHLTMLGLAKTPVTDLTPLVGHKRLKYLRIFNTPVTRQQVEDLQEALPACKIGHDPFH